MTKNNDMIEILAQLLENAKKGDGAKECGRALKVEIKCTDSGVEKVGAVGDKAIFVVSDGEVVRGCVFGRLSAIDVEAMLLAMLNGVAEIDGTAVDGKTIALNATGAFLANILEHGDGDE